jgi:hypothetical protein
MVHY